MTICPICKNPACGLVSHQRMSKAGTTRDDIINGYLASTGLSVSELSKEQRAYLGAMLLEVEDRQYDAPGSPHRQIPAHPSRTIRQPVPRGCGTARSATPTRPSCRSMSSTRR